MKILTKLIALRVSPEQYVRLKFEANLRDMGISEYIRWRLFGGRTGSK